MTQIVCVREVMVILVEYPRLVMSEMLVALRLRWIVTGLLGSGSCVN